MCVCVCVCVQEKKHAHLHEGAVVNHLAAQRVGVAKVENQAGVLRTCGVCECEWRGDMHKEEKACEPQTHMFP